MAIQLSSDEVRVKHFLKADSFGQVISVFNKENDKVRDLVEDTDDFFKHIYENADGILYINGHYNNLTIDKWFENNNNFFDSLNCLLFFIEGYAGCGKSTLVQYILYSILENDNYKYSYYNYDIGIFPQDETKNQNNKIDFIKYSILHGLKRQIIGILEIKEGNDIFDKFKLLMTDEESLQILDRSLEIKTQFGLTKSFISAVVAIFKSNNFNKEQNTNNLEIVLQEQLKSLSTYQLLCVDYLWRLAQYLTDPISYRKYMYVCYDNLDAIMDYDILCDFKEKLVMFRDNLNKYILTLNRNIRVTSKSYGEKVKVIKSFVIFATYRKITAIRSNNRNTEMLDDTITNNNFIKTIEVSKQYNFTQIAQKRITHFSKKLITTNICGKKADKLIRQMEKVNDLKKMTFVKTTYAGLWNNNFRSCSNVLSELIECNELEIDKCIELFKEKIDGHIPDRYCYYGASSLFLHAICRILKKLNIFDNKHLDLINIKEDTQTKKTSLSRLLITYIYTENNSVSITQLFKAFDKVFSPRYICKILGQLMTRVEGEIWRRPIYYSKYALNNEIDIENKLYSQYEKYQNNEEYNYVEFKICDCGETYINAIVPHFEFYSVRINENYQNLYLIEKADDLKMILRNVFEKIKVCCKKQIEFAEDYIIKYNLNKSSYLTLPFHPRTRLKNPQLHIERVIFSHIEYFNKYRMYIISKKINNYNEFNDVLLEVISKYLKLYDKYVSKISNDRNEIAWKLQKKMRRVEMGNKYISIEVD